MINSSNLLNAETSAFMGRQSLPPRDPSRCNYPFIPEYIVGSSIESHDISKSSENNMNHPHHGSSDELLAEEQPAWLDDLLSESESPIMNKAHRRSSSDTAAYLNFASIPYGDSSQLRNNLIEPFTLFQSVDHHDDVWRPNSYGRPQHKGWDHPTKNSTNLKKSVSCDAVNKLGTSSSSSSSKSADKQVKDGASAKADNDSKRIKQQNARRARLRRLQYISELERNVQVLQVEGSEMSSAIHYFDQQLLILSMENRALKQRLDSLAEIQKLKIMEQHVLENEVGKLRILQHQQQQKPDQLIQLNQHNSYPSPPNRELESHFAALAM